MTKEQDMPKKKQFWSLTKALEKAAEKGIELSRPTLIKWIERYNLGHQLGGSGGKWYVNPEKYMRYIDGADKTKTTTD